MEHSQACTGLYHFWTENFTLKLGGFIYMRLVLMIALFVLLLFYRLHRSFLHLPGL